MSATSDFIASIRSALATYDAAQVPVTPPQYNLVIFGDSRMNGDWNTLLGRTDILNISIAGSKATDWLNDQNARVAALVATGCKRFIFQYGKNDFDAGASAAQVGTYCGSIVSAIKAAIPTAKVGVLGILPVASYTQNASALNTKIDQSGTAIYNAISAVGGIWCQGYAGMKGSDNALIQTYTDDGSHLNATGKALYKNSIATLDATLAA